MTGWLTPETLQEPWFAMLATFVGFNTLVYVGLSLAKLWPRRRR